MKCRSAVLAMVLVCGAAGPARADGWYVGAGYADRKELTGLEIDLGYRKQFDRLGLNVSPLNGIWYRNKDSRYRQETTNSGRTICRDRSNGQFADQENCEPDFDYALLLGVDYAFTDKFRLGVGARLGSKGTAYASASLGITPAVRLALRGGRGYGAVNVVYEF